MKLRGDWVGAGFRLRSRLRWGRMGYCETPQSKDDLFADRPDAPALLRAEADLLARYPALTDARDRAGRARYLEILTILAYLDLLWGDAPMPTTRPLRWLDVGAKNWAYIDALTAFIAARAGDDFLLDGVELDPYRLYGDLFTRRAYALAYSAPHPRARYIEGDAMALTGAYDVITLLLPFVFESPHVDWGLPRSAFRPQALLDHVAGALLAPGGTLIILNQGPDEAEAQRALLAPHESAGRLRVRAIGQMPPAFLQYHHPRFGWRCHAPSAPMA